jgi:FkbM family methyltransferase
MKALLRSIGRRIIPRTARNWLRSPTQTIAWARDELRYRIGLNPVVRLRPGWTLVCHPAAYRTGYQAVHHDPDQAAELAAFIAACRPDMVLFDIGAHFGLFSLAALHYGGSSARAVAVEPSPGACRMLRIEARLNAVGRGLTVLEAAAAEQAGEVRMLPIGVIAAGYFTGAVEDRAEADLRPVRTVTLDGLAQELGLKPTHIKIDVEGFEREVLLGARGVLAQHPAPQLFIELHNAELRRRGRDPAATLALLAQSGYRLYHSSGSPALKEDVLAPALIRVVARRA